VSEDEVDNAAALPPIDAGEPDHTHPAAGGSAAGGSVADDPVADDPVANDPVANALAELDTLADRDLAEHPEVFERIHGHLHGALSAIDDA
jgi:hypothetical protein